MKQLRKILLLLMLLLVAHRSQAIILQWYIDNERGTPADYPYDKYAYAQLVVYSADESVWYYSYRIEMDANGQHEYVAAGGQSFSDYNLEEYLTRFEDGETDPAIAYDPTRGYVDHGNPYEDMITENFSGYTFYFRMLDKDGTPITHIDGTKAESERMVFPEDLKEHYFDDASISPTPWIININPPLVPEPATGALALAGCVMLFVRRRKHSSRA